MPRLQALMLGLLFAAGCSKTSPDTAPPEPDDEDDTPSPVQPRVQPIAERPLTASGVAVDPGLAALCDLDIAEVYFEFDSAALSRAAEDIMVGLADCVKGGPLQGRQIEVVGRADPRGSDAYNQALGQSRADSVRAALLRHGVADADVRTSSVGEQEAAGKPSDWPYERRVEIRIAPQYAAR